MCVGVWFFFGKGKGAPHMHGHKESYKDLNFDLRVGLEPIGHIGNELLIYWPYNYA